MIVDFLRFICISAIGLAVDIGLALFMRKSLELPLSLSATVSFLVVAAMNYAIFEFWLFPRVGARFSLARLMSVLAASVAALFVRIAVVISLEWGGVFVLIVGMGDAAILSVAAGASVVINFCLNHFVVFAGRNSKG